MSTKAELDEQADSIFQTELGHHLSFWAFCFFLSKVHEDDREVFLDELMFAAFRMKMQDFVQKFVDDRSLVLTPEDVEGTKSDLLAAVERVIVKNRRRLLRLTPIVGEAREGPEAMEEAIREMEKREDMAKEVEDDAAAPQDV